MKYIISLILMMQISLLTWNVRGIMSSSLGLSRLLESTNCDIAILTELRLPIKCADFPKSVHNNYVSYPGNAYKSDILCGSGGITILRHKRLKYNVNEVVIPNSNRITGLQIYTYDQRHIYVFGVYMPSDSNIEEYETVMEQLHDICYHYSQLGEIIFAGDFNAQYDTLPISQIAKAKSKGLNSE